MTDSIMKILPPQPHFLSGYTGYVPGNKFHSGRSFGRLTHDLFLDPTIKRSNVPVLSDLIKVQNDWQTPEEKTTLENRCNSRQCSYNVDMASSYKGYVPHTRFLSGHNFKKQTTMALNKLENMRSVCTCPDCRKMKDMQNLNENTHNNSTVNFNEHVHLLKKIPGAEKLFKEKCKLYTSTLPVTRPTKPYFLKNEDPHKKFMTGYTGHVPNLRYVNGTSYNTGTREALKLFTEKYENVKTTAQNPIIMETINPPILKYTSQKLPYEDGIIKNYMGHIPGDKFNVGKTFSNGSKSVRHVLEQKQVTIGNVDLCKLG